MPETLLLLQTVIWAGAITILVSLDLRDKHLWIPVLLALAGVFGSILTVVVAPNVALVANAITLVLFIVSLQQSRQPKRRRAITFVAHRGQRYEAAHR